jgi:hypothetical protein
MAAFGQAAIGNVPLPNISIISQYVNLFQYCGCPENERKY